ncbi:MAG TPA: hypothetical protein VFG30_31630 [Polyangiales bacterium]|nr:hypothetical protein [Polyangiales bacterium]
MNTSLWSGLSNGRRLALLAGFSRLSLAVLLVTACGDDDEPKGDAGPDAAVSGDASVLKDGAVADAGAKPAFGPCVSDADCPDDTFCDKEIPGSTAVSGAPGEMVDRALFPGGSCSPKPLAPYDSMAACDSSLPQPVQGCGAKGRCVLESLNDDTYAGCRAACEPTATASGCDRAGYTCDFALHACIEGCRSDPECRVLVKDNNNDGTPDTLAYDTDTKAVCDPKTARCAHPGTAEVATGHACERIDDCSATDECLVGPSALGGLDFPGGYCTTTGCEVAGRECNGSGTVCEPLRPWLGATSDTSLCLLSCKLGSEPEDLRVGARGHGAGCREGYRCHWNGGSGADDGVCVGGVYNDVKSNNGGKACASDSECYSPYGHGSCLLYTATDARIRAPTGTCTILDCNAPGLPDGICGAGNECVAFASDLTFCIRNCTSAAECAAGYACTDDDADPSSPSVCFPACVKNTDCRTNERCTIAAGATAGRCVAMAGSSG